MTDTARLLATRSFVELGARQRARALLDDGSFRELLGPFDRVMSPWLPRQGIVPRPTTAWWWPRAASTASRH